MYPGVSSVAPDFCVIEYATGLSRTVIHVPYVYRTLKTIIKYSASVSLTIHQNSNLLYGSRYHWRLPYLGRFNVIILRWFSRWPLDNKKTGKLI